MSGRMEVSVGRSWVRVAVFGFLSLLAQAEVSPQCKTPLAGKVMLTGILYRKFLLYIKYI